MSMIHNPVISGFYPDPTAIRVGEDFYLACSSFELVPGLPIFHSRDLAHWEQIGNAMTPENGLRMEKNSMGGGLMAPTLRYHNGTFYIINTNFSDKGNYIITAKDPAGPWSEPHFLDDVPGIDASLFFDEDGKTYVIGTGNVWDNGTGVMERGIWLAEYDVEAFRMKGEPVTIFNSALRVGASPESPHIYKRGDYYYLIIAEGGTEHYHAVMAARSKDLFGFYEGCPANPVLTHRHLGFRAPIINIGHADLVDLPDGSWCAFMLGSRLIDGEYKNLGRETFYCPVVWERDWPFFATETGKVEESYPIPSCLQECPLPKRPAREDFEGEKLPMDFVFWGEPQEGMWKIENSALTLSCLSSSLWDDLRPFTMGVDPVTAYTPAFAAMRQTAVSQRFLAKMCFVPQEGEEAGLAIVQAMNHQIHLARTCKEGRGLLLARLVTSDFPGPQYLPGFTSTTHEEILLCLPCEEEEIILGFAIEGETVRLLAGPTEAEVKEVGLADAGKINPEKVGCMTGTVVGMFASGKQEKRGSASFDWFERS